MISNQPRSIDPFAIRPSLAFAFAFARARAMVRSTRRRAARRANAIDGFTIDDERAGASTNATRSIRSDPIRSIDRVDRFKSKHARARVKHTKRAVERRVIDVDRRRTRARSTTSGARGGRRKVGRSVEAIGARRSIEAIDTRVIYLDDRRPTGGAIERWTFLVISSLLRKCFMTTRNHNGRYHSTFRRTESSITSRSTSGVSCSS